MKNFLQEQARILGLDPMGRAQNWLISQGYTDAVLLSLSNSLTQFTAAGTMNSHPKLAAVYSWTQQVKADAIAGKTKFSKAPYPINDVIAE